jgi:hypothetical protein
MRHNRQAGAGIAASRPLQVDDLAGSFRNQVASPGHRNFSLHSREERLTIDR